MRKKRVYYILMLFILPLCTFAQEVVSSEQQDSIAVADITEAAAAKEAVEVAADSAAAAAVLARTRQNYALWDQASPALADTIQSYADYPLVIRGVPDTLLNMLRKDKDLQYVLRTKEPPKENTALTKFLLALSQLLGYFPWLVIIFISACFAWLLYVYLKQNGYLFKRKLQHTVKVTGLEEEVQTVDVYHQQIEQAIKDGRFRVAVRLLYLQTLKVLVDKEIISYSREKTNAAYLRSMLSTPFYKQFAALTLDYEYIWYGEVPVDNTQFNNIHTQFRQFMNELGYTR
ncbi:hypothetical protein [Chitinophaga rhizophila]|uniref:DUF4129 domain-containing protein n=1 Tax=Chitinophaga rhizophila TaxID=2866212 RepID=A0ABS7GAR4_9BACT|nr:hypothetical protein [Chitinophaga rhizophila]MBW8684230.1 hypothetical protein [Chitinophaga rhizophila]